MPKNTNLSNLSVNVEADAFAVLLDGGFIDIYDGKQPDSADTPITTQILGVTLAFGSPAFGRADKGIITSNPIKSGVAVNTVNPAKWARITRSDHKTVVMDVSVGTAKANIIVPTTNIAAGVMVTCSAYSHSIAKSAPGS